MFSMTSCLFFFNLKNSFINADYGFLNFKKGSTLCNLSSEAITYF